MKKLKCNLSGRYFVYPACNLHGAIRTYLRPMIKRIFSRETAESKWKLIRQAATGRVRSLLISISDLRLHCRRNRTTREDKLHAARNTVSVKLEINFSYLFRRTFFPPLTIARHTLWWSTCSSSRHFEHKNGRVCVTEMEAVVKYENY